MTDRYNAFIVILEQDIRSDDAEATIAAIKQIKGVLDVKPYIADISTSIAESRVKTMLFNSICELFWEKSE